mgnify:CR=1 FL=1
MIFIDLSSVVCDEIWNLPKFWAVFLETKVGRKFLSDILIIIYSTHRVLSTIVSSVNSKDAEN